MAGGHLHSRKGSGAVWGAETGRGGGVAEPGAPRKGSATQPPVGGSAGALGALLYGASQPPGRGDGDPPVAPQPGGSAPSVVQ